MTENINVGQTVTYELVCFDGDNGTGNVVPDPGQFSVASDNTAVLTADAVAGTQDVTVEGVTAGNANVQATTSTGVVAGSLDAGGNFVAGPLPFLVAAVTAVIRSAILRVKAAVSPTLRRG